MSKQHIFVPLCLVVLFFSCNKDTVAPPTTECTGTTPTYAADVKAIVDKNCAYSGCHSATSKADGIDLSTYALVKSESAKARFMGSINQVAGYTKMPKGTDKLPAASIKTLTCWIQSGTPQ
jgi:hypothetical protein